MEPNIELHLINYKLKIISIKKKSIHKLMYPLIKIALTNRTKCTFISFTETNDDYSIIVDLVGFSELSPYLDEHDITLSQSNWIPMYLCGDDLQGAMSLSKIAKYLILPLADWKISIMAISMYQCDYVLIQEKDYDTVIKCLMNYIPKIYDESLPQENEIVYMRSAKGGKTILNLKSSNSSTSSSSSLSINSSYSSGQKHSSSSSESSFHSDSNDINHKQNKNNQMQITLPLLIPDDIEYCITGLYDLEKFLVIIPTLIDIMFYETEDYRDNEIFFNFTKKETDISIVMETRLLKKFPHGILLNVENDYWKLVRIGQAPVGFEVFGVCASVSQPLELENIDEYYISSYHTGYCFIPVDKLQVAKECFAKGKARFVDASKMVSTSDETNPDSSNLNYVNNENINNRNHNSENGHEDNNKSLNTHNQNDEDDDDDVVEDEEEDEEEEESNGHVLNGHHHISKNQNENHSDSNDTDVATAADLKQSSFSLLNQKANDNNIQLIQ